MCGNLATPKPQRALEEFWRISLGAFSKELIQSPHHSKGLLYVIMRRLEIHVLCSWIRVLDYRGSYVPISLEPSAIASELSQIILRLNQHFYSQNIYHRSISSIFPTIFFSVINWQIECSVFSGIGMSNPYLNAME